VDRGPEREGKKRSTLIGGSHGPALLSRASGELGGEKSDSSGGKVEEMLSVAIQATKQILSREVRRASVDP